jgi:hypothetical protein
MNENHQRHLRMTFQHVSNLLSETEHVLAASRSPSPFQQYTQDSAPKQRQIVRAYILRVREAMRRILAELNIPPKPPISGAIWAARNHLAFASLAIEEISPRHMKAYGELSETDKRTLNRITAELTELLDGLNKDIAQGAEAHSPSEERPSDTIGSEL